MEAEKDEQYKTLYGDFLNWGQPQMDGLHWKIPLKWVIWGTPISGNLHMTIKSMD